MYYKKLFASLSLLGLCASCAVQSASTGLTKYQQAVVQYEAQKYYQAAQLFEEALPQLRGRKEEASAHFYWAYASFYEKKYLQSASRFKYFRKTFPRDPRLEEALYMQAHVLYLRAPEKRLDQTFAHEGIYLFQSYLERYPEGIYADKARVQLAELNDKVALKVFKSAQLYYKLAHYRAAVVTLENFQKDFPSSYSGQAAYLKADAQYRCFQVAPEDKKQAYLGIAITYCQEFLDSHPDSPYTTAVKKIYNTLRTRQ